MSLTVCKNCGRTLTWREIDHNERIERRKNSSDFLCTSCGQDDFKTKLAAVKARIAGKHQDK